MPPTDSGRALRDWLTSIPGIGHKTASWIARNWLCADDVAILDIHILRAGLLAGFFPGDLTVERDYLKLEQIFLEFSEAMGVKASELDALIWYEMQASSSTVFSLIENMRDQPLAKLRPRSSRAKTASPVPARRPSSFNPQHQSWPVMPSGQNCILALRQQAPSAQQEHQNRAKQGYQHLNILLTFFPAQR